jgi:hypothetical protein
VVGVFADDGLELPRRQQLVLAFAQVQDDVGAAAGFLDLLDRVVALPADSQRTPSRPPRRRGAIPR